MLFSCNCIIAEILFSCKVKNDHLNAENCSFVIPHVRVLIDSNQIK